LRDGAIVEADVAEPCLAQRNKGVLADRAADVSGRGSLTTCRGSPTTFRSRATNWLSCARSGPTISMMPFRGAAGANAATTAVTPAAAMGWNRPGEIPTMFLFVLESAMLPRNSMNRVDRIMLSGMPDGTTNFSWRPWRGNSGSQASGRPRR